MQLPLFEYSQFVSTLTSGYPEIIWYVPSLVLAILALTAFIDARTARVPTMPLLFVLVASFLALAFFAGWVPAFERAYPVVLPVIILCFINVACVKFTKHDAFGMGDVKWTAVAAFAFGLWPVFWAWVIGAWLALIWLGFRRIIKRLGSQNYQGYLYVHFVPFLFLGLCLALLFNLQTL